MRKHKLIFNLIMILLICSFATSGCRFFYSSKLRAPIVTANETDMTLMWDTNYNASGYEIQMNETIVATIESDGEKTQYTYSYADVVGQFGEFRFRVKCIGSGKYADSDLSQVVTVKIGSAGDYLNKNITSTEYVYNEDYAVSNVKITNDRLTWTGLDNADLTGYLVSIYTNTLGIKHYETNTNSLEITGAMVSGNDVMAIKVCSVINGINYETEGIYYYNPVDDDKYGKYTDTIYLFDGAVYDYYIENWSELQNLYYYAFIYRIESIDFLVSDLFYEEYDDIYFDTITPNQSNTGSIADDYIFGSGDTAYFETAGFDSAPTLMKLTYSTNEFRLKCRFEDFDLSASGVNTEPYVEGTAYYTQDANYTPYYETINYTKRSADYDEFVSDDWYLETAVDSSEELFWAVSTHITPVFDSNTSRAYLVYEEAKNVLRQIISDEMTDYEKALSIFDYIMLNTTYDYNTFQASSSDNPMQYMCYYLEGVFLSANKLSVCDGYSKAFALLCNMEGINCVRIMGTAGGGGHAWNKVEINEAWYVVDITWTALSMDLTDDNVYNPNEICSHTYFLLSDSDVSTHSEFDNRYVFSLLSSPNSYNFYVTDKIQANEQSLSRVVKTVDELKSILTNSLIDDYKSVEIVIDSSLFYSYGNSTTPILKNAKEYSFIAMEQVPYVNVFGEYICFYYDSENLNNQGVLMLIKPSVSITTDTRFNDFVAYVKEVNPEKHSKVCLSTSKINEWIGTNYSSDAEMISLLELHFNEAFGEGISVDIKRISEDVTEQVTTQDEHGNWINTTMTSGNYSFTFIYSI